MNERLSTLLRQSTSSYHQRLQRMEAVRQLELPPFAARLLDVVGRNPGISQNEIAVVAERDKAQVARAVAQLEARGLVRRTASEENWRLQCLWLTDQGNVLHQPVLEERAALQAEIVSQFSEAEYGQLCTLLERLIATLDEA